MMTHTWTLQEPNEWPFSLIIKDENGDVITRIDRHAHSSTQRNLEDCMNAVGFKGNEREEIVQALKEQRKKAVLMTSAPELLEALKDALDNAVFYDGTCDCCLGGCYCEGEHTHYVSEREELCIVAEARAAIKKVEK